MTTVATRFETSTLATAAAISELTDRVMAFLDAQGVDIRATHHTALVLDEILTNLGTHGACAGSTAMVAVVVEPERVTGQIVDAGPPFDPRQARDPALDLVLADRPIGGLGLYLVRKLSATLEYARRNDQNCTTFAISRNSAMSAEAPPDGNS
jgi:anti-sigma regulatory factor (Ser/Thr protein kinase)